MQGAAEAAALACAGAAGICASDIIRAIRGGSRASGFIGGVLDFLSIAAGAAALWLALLYIARGELRLHWFMCVALGAALYIFTVKNVIYRIFYIIFKNIFKFLHLIFKILLTPARFLYKIICVGLYKITVAECRQEGDENNVKKA